LTVHDELPCGASCSFVPIIPDVVSETAEVRGRVAVTAYGEGTAAWAGSE